MNRFRKRLEDNMLLGLVIAAVVVIVGWCVKADAQPELKVGQEVEIFTREGPSCSGIYRGKRAGGILVVDAGPDTICSFPQYHVVGYRILKPAPRSEFEYSPLPEAFMGHPRDMQQDIYFEDIRNELRWLREQIEGRE